MKKYSREELLKIGLQKYQDKKKKDLDPIFQKKCQKCLKIGHLTYECKNERVYLSRPSRTTQLLNQQKASSNKRVLSESDDSSTLSSSSSTSESSSSDSSSDSSDEESEESQNNKNKPTSTN